MTRGTSMKIIPTLVLGLFSSYASASGFQLTEQNASGLGNAYAGSAAVAENASTVFYNPAGMTQLQSREFSGGLAAITTSYKFSNGSSNTGLLSGNGGDGGGTGFVPNAYLSLALTKDLYVGLGVGAPFGLKTEYDNPWTGAAQSHKFEVKTMNVNPSLAYRVNDKVSLGLGLNWQKLDAQYVRTAGVGPVPGAPSQSNPFSGVPTQLSTADLNLNDNAWGWNIGGLFTVSATTKVGVSYRSAIQYHATGSVNVSGNPVAAFDRATSSNVKADIKLPDTFILSVTQKLNDKWEMLGDLSWTGWSSIPKIDIIRTSGVQNGAIAQTLATDFRDTWRVALGANYQYNDTWKLKYGIAYDQTPVKGADTRLVSLPDNNRVWFSAGAQWKPSKATTVDIGAAYLYVKDGQINNNQLTSLRGLVNGTYQDSAWILGAQYSQAF